MSEFKEMCEEDEHVADYFYQPLKEETQQTLMDTDGTATNLYKQTLAI